MSTQFFSDELFIVHESYFSLDEGKSLGTAHVKHLTLLNHKFQNSGFSPFPFSDQEKQTTEKHGLSVGKQKLSEIQTQVRASLLGLIARFKSDKITEVSLRKRAVRSMKEAWKATYSAGIRAGGVPGKSTGPGKVTVPLHAGHDDVWLKGAMSHEMRFFNGFLEAIIHDTHVMPLTQRTEMYVQSLQSFFNSARVIALPENVLLRWVGPNDRRTCEGCRYMFENSPYTKLNLPTVPKAGLTPCLTNCRDRIFVQKVSIDEVKTVLEGAKFTRGGHISNLRKIKRQGHL